MLALPSQTTTPPEAGVARRLTHPIAIVLLLAVITAAVYWPAARYEFIEYDDDEYVTDNAVIQRGSIPHALAWSLTTTHAGNWHPLTWWSHLLDYRLFGLQAGGHHLSSLVLHGANGVLLFGMLRQMTRRLWPSALAAALFAWHPLQVESVAWVAERKNVLSTFFFLLTVWAYARYAQVESPKSKVQSQGSAAGSLEHATRNTQHASPSYIRPHIFYLLSLFCFALGLMSKPMLVTLPFVLLLLDYWPLQRVGWGNFKGARPEVLRLIREKIPFLVLSGFSCGVTYWAQSKGAAMEAMADLPMTARAGNAVMAYARYLGKLFWPVDLAVFYPHPGHWPWAGVAAAGLILAGLCFLALWLSRRAAYLTVGLFWFLGMLVPVIGLVQVGGQSLADRYVYVPAIGLFIAGAWGFGEVVVRWRLPKTLVWVGAGAMLAACAGRTRDQLQYWQKGEKLFAHTLAVTQGNCVAYDCLASARYHQGRVDEAITLLRKALELRPDYALSHHNLGCALLARGSMDEAVTHLRKALELQPDYAEAHNNLGVALRQQGQLVNAMTHFQRALEIRPDYAKAHNNLGLELRRQGQLKDAIAHFLRALEIQPDYAEAHKNIGLAMLESGRREEAIGHFQQALAIRPDYAQAKEGLNLARRQQPRVKEPIAP